MSTLVEHLAIAAEPPHRPFCERVKQLLKLSELHYESDENSEWAEVELAQGSFNITRLYDQEDLLELPGKCNSQLMLSIYEEHPHAGDADWSYRNLVIPIAHALASEFQTDVYHMRTWFGPGDVEPRNERFSP